MKRKLILSGAIILCTIVMCGSAAAWGRMGHATVVKIAQNHFTKTTAKKVNEIMHGQLLVAFASYADEYRSELDAAYSPAWAHGVPHAHTFEVDENGHPFDTLFHPQTGRKLTNAVYFADHCLQELSHAKDLTAQERWYALVMVAHLIGDMHCPGHIRYADKHNDIAKFPVVFKGEKDNYHHVWDDGMVVTVFPYSFSDLAEICDDCTKEQMEEICKGSVYDWGTQVAAACRETRKSVKDGDNLDRVWSRDHSELSRTQMRNGGYRLAHALNMVFDPKYARKHSK